MKSALTLRQKGIVIVVVPVLIELFFLVGLVVLLRQAEAELKREVLAAQIISTTGQLQKLYYDGVANCALWNTTRSERALKNLNSILSDIDTKKAELLNVLSKDASQNQLAERLRSDCSLGSALMVRVRDGAPRDLGGSVDTRKYQRQATTYVKRILEDCTEVTAYAKQIEKAAPADEERSREYLFGFILLGVLTNIGAAIYLAMFFAGGITSRLLVVRDNALRLARNEPLRPPLPKNDEISELDKVFHQMAASLKHAARKERALVDNAVDVLCSIDRELRFVKVSPACERVWGYTPDEMIATRLASLVDPDDGAILNQVTQAMNDQNESAFDGRLKRKDGRVIDTRWVVVWSSEEKNLFCVVHDSTQERELERLKQQLMDTVAHDLRTPLTAVKATLNLLSLGVLGELSTKAVERVTNAEQSVERLVRLVNDLLDFDKLESGNVAFDFRTQKVSTILDESIKAISQLLEEENIRVDAAPTELCVRADVDRLVQVVVNSLSNAVKFSPHDGLITVAVSQQAEMVEISISDQGPGVPDDLKATIFERFRQAPNTGGAHKGTGLGLAIAKQIVERHGGQIGVADGSGGGSRFWITIPVGAVELVPATQRSLEVSNANAPVESAD